MLTSLFVLPHGGVVMTTGSGT